ncbi:hypothetical protein V1512DRAFT_292959 [Lipomyces arxii]|uniref:uncharacterized protein n=1 Tax=Lipomyces arxii TaxID=56418 RepID=UPI0034CD3F7D
MGRRKILIKPLKDERNRSVTFLKRKAGLFKKAHELSVLCSVEIAVIIFGNNRKLYEFTSSDTRKLIERYNHTTPQESKGPSDFQKGSEITDDDQELDNEVYSEYATPEPPDRKKSLSRASNLRATSPKVEEQSARVAQSKYHMQSQQKQQLQNSSNFGSLSSPPLRAKSHTHSRSHSHNSITSQGQSVTARSSIEFQASNNDSAGLAAAALVSFPTHGFYDVQSHQQEHQQSMLSHQQQLLLQNQQVQRQQQNRQQTQFVEQSQPPQRQQQYSIHTFQTSQQPFADHRSHTVSPQLQSLQYNLSSDQPYSDLKMSFRSKSSSTIAQSQNDMISIKQEQEKQQHALSSQQTHGAAQEHLQAVSLRTQDIGLEMDEDSIAVRQMTGRDGEYTFDAAHSQQAIDDANNSPNLSIGSTGMRPKLKLQIPPGEMVQTIGATLKATNNAGTSSTDRSTVASPSSAFQDHNSAPPLSSVKDVSSPVVLLPPPSPSAYVNANNLGGPGNPFARPTTLNGGSLHSNNASQGPGIAVGSGRDQTPISALPSRYVSDLLPSPSTLYTPAEWNLNFSAKSGMLGQDLLPSPLQFHTPVVSSVPQYHRDRQTLIPADKEAEGLGIKHRPAFDDEPESLATKRKKS